MGNIHLRVLLPRNRNLSGWLRVEVEGTPRHEFEVLGRGSRGPGNTSLLENGNTPTGEYDGSNFAETSSLPQSSYGPYGEVRLRAIGGMAVLAEALGRNGLLIHGGDLSGPGYWRGQGQLKATKGCLRLHNRDVLTLRGVLFGQTKDAATGICKFPSVTVTVEETP